MTGADGGHDEAAFATLVRFESLDAEGDEFGLERMMQSVQASAGEGAPAIVNRLTDDVQNFIGTQARHDDITLIAIRKT